MMPKCFSAIYLNIIKKSNLTDVDETYSIFRKLNKWCIKELWKEKARITNHARIRHML